MQEKKGYVHAKRVKIKKEHRNANALYVAPVAKTNAIVSKKTATPLIVI
jgi:hypothetical protein